MLMNMSNTMFQNSSMLMSLSAICCFTTLAWILMLHSEVACGPRRNTWIGSTTRVCCDSLPAPNTSTATLAWWLFSRSSKESPGRHWTPIYTRTSSDHSRCRPLISILPSQKGKVSEKLVGIASLRPHRSTRFGNTRSGERCTTRLPSTLEGLLATPGCFLLFMTCSSSWEWCLVTMLNCSNTPHCNIGLKKQTCRMKTAVLSDGTRFPFKPTPLADTNFPPIPSVTQGNRLT